MKSTSKLLNFNSDRKLKFTVFRDVAIRPNRNLFFNIDRKMLFNPNRQLNFGKKGVVFRTFVCSSCGHEVSPTDTRCVGCGVRFEVQSSNQKRIARNTASEGRGKRAGNGRAGEKTGGVGKGGKATAGSGSRGRTKRGKTRATFQCPVCGRAMYVGTVRCPGCRLVFDFNKKGDGR